MRRLGLSWLSAMVLISMGSAAAAEDYPNQTIRMISGVQTGSSGDVAGRMLALKMTAAFAQPVVFEGRPGANGVIATRAVKSASPDGYTLLFVSSSTIVTGPFLVKDVGFDPLTDFTPVSLAVAVPSFLAVNSSVPANSTLELIEYARRNPGKLAYGSTGRGSAFHMIGEALKLDTGIDMLHVPYSGASNTNIVSDLMNNRIQVFFPSFTTIQSALPTGTVKLLAVFDTVRSTLFPQLPTVNETLPTTKIVPSWFGLVGPSQLPEPIVIRLQRALKAALADPEVSAKLDALGITAVGSTPEQFAASLRKGIEDVRALTTTLGIEPN